MENRYRDIVSLYPRTLSYNCLAREHYKPIINKTFNFPKTQAECIICYEDKTCYQVSCCQKEMCHNCLERVEDTKCPHCREENCL